MVAVNERGSSSHLSLLVFSTFHVHQAQAAAPFVRAIPVFTCLSLPPYTSASSSLCFSTLVICFFPSYIPLPFCAPPYLRKTEVAFGIMANFQAHSNMLSQQQEWLTNICDRQLQSFNTLSQQQFQSFHDLYAQALAQQQTQSPYATAPQHGPSALANTPAVQLPEISTSTRAASSVQQSLQTQFGPTVSLSLIHI